MPHYRDHLPQLNGEQLLTDGGIETTLVFEDGLDLPLFASFVLLEDEQHTAALRRAYEAYVEVARDHGLGILLESPTWRASPDWGRQLGYAPDDLDRLNRKAIDLLTTLRNDYRDEVTPFVISGCIGPQSDGYNPSTILSADEAETYHSTQVATFADTVADLVSAFTLTYADEAIGITRAAQAADMPVVISFTLETDGRLPSTQALGDAITQVDDATDAGPDYYMINCAHPTHFDHILEPDAPWLDRIRGLRANASTKSHAELDEATELDAGNPTELGAQYEDLTNHLTNLTVLGGCCGTDHHHVNAIATATQTDAALR